MICTTNKTEKGTIHKLKRQNWKEFFVFFVSWRHQEEIHGTLGWAVKLYYKRKVYDRAGEEYWLWPVAVVPLTKILWWRLGTWCLMKDLLHNLPPAGTRVHWFWPKYFLK